MRRVRVRAWGRVQGVFYRATCSRRARELGLAGSVRNVPDGSVEAILEGDDDAVETMIAWCREGPGDARVDGIEVTDEEVTGASSFVVER
jgi:acylphosphatase